MLSHEVIACFAATGEQLAKRAAAKFDVSGRMSSALSAVRTKMGAVGGPKSAGRITGAPSVHAPSAQGVPQVHAESTPRLAFPQMAKPPRV